MKIYNKLVRDNIPEICSANGEKAYVSCLSDIQYNAQLKKKLLEEVDEFLENDDVEELADIIEVVEALAVFNGCGFEELLKIKEKKANKNGKFHKRLFLEKVE